jgi:hypothetical protein
LPLQAVFVRLKIFTDPLNESERQPIYALQEGIDKLLVVINKLGLNFGKREIFKSREI